MMETPKEAATREALGPGLIEAAARQEIVVVDADLGLAGGDWAFTD